jgi:hypothetical protein
LFFVSTACEKGDKHVNITPKTEYGTLKEVILDGTEGVSFPGASKTNKEFTDQIPDETTRGTREAQHPARPGRM